MNVSKFTFKEKTCFTGKISQEKQVKQSSFFGPSYPHLRNITFQNRTPGIITQSSCPTSHGRKRGIEHEERDFLRPESPHLDYTNSLGLFQTKILFLTTELKEI